MCFRRNILLCPQTINLFKFLLFLSTYFSTRVRLQVLKEVKSFFLLLHTGQVTFPGGSDDKESACSAGDLCSIPGLERSPGEGNDYPLQYLHLENSMNGEAWLDTVHRVTKNHTQLSD